MKQITPACNPLTDRERKAADLMMKGFVWYKLAPIMNVTHNTIKAYRKFLYSKLNITSIRGLFRLELCD